MSPLQACVLVPTVCKPTVLYRSTRGAEGNFVKINLKKKSHVKGYALRGVGLRKQVRCEHLHDPRMEVKTHVIPLFSYTWRSSS